jgi:hypothetical protein
LAGGRPFWTITVFVFALLGVLAALVFVLVIRLIFGREGIGIETVAIIGAMLIAVLPVRAVLVPSAIGSLVLVDYALAFLMALLVAALIFAQFRANPRATT